MTRQHDKNVSHQKLHTKRENYGKLFSLRCGGRLDYGTAFKLILPRPGRLSCVSFWMYMAKARVKSAPHTFFPDSRQRTFDFSSLFSLRRLAPCMDCARRRFQWHTFRQLIALSATKRARIMMKNKKRAKHDSRVEFRPQINCYKLRRFPLALTFA